MPRPGIIKAQLMGLDDDDVESHIERIARHEYAGVECGLNDDPATVAAALDRFGLEATSVMTGLDYVQSPEDDLLEACEELGTDRVVLGYLPEPRFESPETVRETAQILNDCARELAEYGIELCYHNHDHEFATFDDRTAIDILIEELDETVKFEVDVGWVGVGGASPVTFIEQHADRIPLIHLKDMDFETGESLTLGTGDLDVEGIIRAADRAGVDWLIYEHEQPDDAISTIENGARRMADHLTALEREVEN